MYSSKFVVFCEKSLCSGKSGFVRESGCIRVKLLYLGKRCFIRAKMDVFGQSGCNRQTWLYSSTVVVVGQTSCLRAEWLYSSKNGYIRGKWL